MGSSRIIFAAGLSLCACSHSVAPGAPVPSVITPAAAHTVADVPVVIKGTGFLLTASRRLGSGRVDVDGSFSATLGATRLRNVAWVDEQTLRAVVPAGLVGDALDLTVEGPTGRGSLAGAFSASPLTPPSLLVALIAPAQVEAGHPFVVQAQVSNSGAQEVAGLAVSLPGGPTLSFAPAASPQAAVFRYSGQASSIGDISLSAAATAVDVFTGDPVKATSSPVSIRVLAGPRLRTVPHALPAAVDVGQLFEVAMDVVNDGDADALGAQLAAPATGLGTAVLAGPAAPSQDVPAGATRTFAWSLRGQAAGPLMLTAAGTAVDGLTTLSLPLQVAWALAAVQSPAGLSAAVSVPSAASVGQRIVLRLDVSNGGDAAALGVVPALQQGPALAIAAAPVAQDIPGHATRQFVWQLDASGPGSATLVLGAQGKDANTGMPVSASPLPQPTVLVQTPASLTATAAGPAQVSMQQTFAVSVQLTNSGQAAALGVASGAPTCSGAGALQLVSQSAAQDLPGNQMATVSWTFRAVTAGAVDCSLAANGADANTGSAVGASAAIHIVVQSPAALTVSLLAAPTLVSRGQSFNVSLTVTNSGGATASQVRPSPSAPTVVAGGGASASTSSSQSAVTLASGQSATFTWTFQEAGTGPGTLSFFCGAAGNDANSSASLVAPAASASATVQRPAALAVTAFTVRSALGLATIDRGQDFVASVTVSNSGDASAAGVLPSPLAPVVAPTGGAAASTSSAPAAAAIAGGASATFSWTFNENGTGPGSLQLSVGASGRDANSSASLSATAATSNVLSVQSAPALSIVSFTLPANLSRGQSFTLALTVRNNGGATASGVVPDPPVFTASGGAHASTSTAQTAVSLAAGASATFSWSYLEDGAATGTLAFTARATGTDANTGGALASAQAAAPVATVQRPAALSISSFVAPALIDRGQSFQVTLVVANTGGAAAQNVVPSQNPPALVAGGGASAGAPAALPPVTIAGGQSATFTWTYLENGSGTGSLSFSTGASGTDTNSAAPLTAASVTATSTVQRPAALAVTAFTLRSALGNPTFNRGQAFTASLTVTNTGDATATGVLPSVPTATTTGGAAATTSFSPLPATIAGGASATFRWSYLENGSAPGTLRLASSAGGTDGNSGSAISSGAAQSEVATVQAPAALSASLTAPSLVAPLQTFTVSLTVTNSGGSTVNALAPSSLSITGASTTVLSGPTPASATLGGAGSATFSWTCRANAIGLITITASASGTDANDGSTKFASASTSSTVSEVVQIASDPFGDGSTYSSLFDFNGRVYLGPNKNGTGGVRMLPDGSSVEKVTFAFNNDSGQGNLNSYNGGLSPYPSLGFTGCTPNTAQCGPDNEDGRGMYTSGIIAGTPWLMASGSASGGRLSHLYATRDTMTAPDFSFVGLKNVINTGEAQGTSAMMVFRDRIYVSFPSTKKNKPFLAVVNTPPPTPGYDATTTDVVDLGSTIMPYVGANGSPGNTAATQMIDTFAVFNDRLYLGNNGGWMRSTTNAPGPYGVAPGDWAIATPSAGAYTAKTSVTTSKLADLEPADRALPQMAVLSGKLYAARNTTIGPQLWACTPGINQACDPANWSLLAANTSGDKRLSQFNDLNNAAVSLLVATPAHLYVGFDDAIDGVRVYKSTTASPSTTADFQGKGGCNASAGSAACPGLGGNGFGAAVTRLFDGRALNYGGVDYVYLAAGTGTSGVRIFRLPE